MHEKGQPHDVEYWQGMCTDDGTANVAVTVPRQAGETDPIVVREDDRLWERDRA